MFPDIVIFDKQFTYYTIMWLLGIFAIGILACYYAKKAKKDDNEVIMILLVAGFGALIGSHILYGYTNLDNVLYVFTHLNEINSIEMFFQYLIFAFGGSVFYGGLFGGMLAAFLYMKKSKKNLDREYYVWMFTPLIPLFHFFGRMGCFLSGCCYGVETSSFGVVYNYSLSEGANGPLRFPVQLVEALLNLALFAVLTYFFKKGLYKKYLLHIYLMSYAVIRFSLEFLRGDLIRGVYGWISTSQIISLLVLIAVPVAILISVKKEPKAQTE